MEKIYWIEDNIDRALEIVNETYYSLWGNESEDGISSTFCFFGDAYKSNEEEQPLTKKQIQLFDEKVKVLMRRHCKNLEKWKYSGNLYEKKKKLIEEQNMLIAEGDTKISNILNVWRNEEELKKYVEDKVNDKYSVKPILDEMGIIETESTDKIRVGIDVVLLLGDIERVYKGLPIISMEIYTKTEERGYKCFLYSSYTYDAMLIEKYKEIYEETYKKDIKIIRERDFFRGMQSKNTIFSEIEEKGQ